MKLLFMSRYTLLTYLFLFIPLGFNVSFAQELKTVDAEQFILENPSSERKKIVDFLIHQFDDKQEVRITQAELDHIWSDKDIRNKLMMYRFQIIDQKLYADS